MRKTWLVWIACLAGVSLCRGEVALDKYFSENYSTNLVWSRAWAHDAGSVQLAPDQSIRHGSGTSLRIEHRGARDWALAPETPCPVKKGELVEASAWVRLQGKGSVAVCFALRDAANKTLSWSAARDAQSGDADWRLLRSRMLIPEGVVVAVPRLIGDGAATVWMEDFHVRRLTPLTQPTTVQPVALHGDEIDAAFDPASAAFSICDKRTSQIWRQAALKDSSVLVLAATVEEATIKADLFDPVNDLLLKMSATLDAHAPELVVDLAADGPMRAPLVFPPAFVPVQGTRLIVPLNEGIAYPIEDQAVKEQNLVAYGGHGICMAFFGATDGKAGQMTLLETPDDATLQLRRDSARMMTAQPTWVPEKGRFGYARRLRYVFFDQGGHVAMCKRYRAYVAAAGRLKTFTQKRAENPNVDLLAGAVNVWFMDGGQIPMVQALQSNGIRRILWSAAGSPAQIAEMNKLDGVLTSRYDIYQDAMNPANFPKLRGIHSDWTSAAWPNDIMIRADGDWVRGWEVSAKDGTRIPCGVLCDRQALTYARARLAEDLRTHPYRCRFIDTTTASPWRECYAPAHPMTRRESREFKMQLLDVVSREFKQVCGAETGHDAAVPYLHYFEGMLSLGPYRVNDAGRNMMQKLDEIPEQVAKFQMGAEYRLPLWELVYHDCVVAQWYWGDYNNKLPKLWDKRDLFNALYGTPPMFMFNRHEWERDHARFVQSYRATSPVARTTFYSEMTDHRFLSTDRLVQQTHFANGTTVTVNFGSQPFTLADGRTVGPLAADVTPQPVE